jgi:hypothetical protein
MRLDKLHNEELYNLHSSPVIFRMIQIKEKEICGALSRMVKKCVQSFGRTARRKETTGMTQMDVSIILRCILKYRMVGY